MGNKIIQHNGNCGRIIIHYDIVYKGAEMTKYYKYGDAQYRASEKYRKENIRRVVISLNKKLDADIIEYLDNTDNIQGTVKNLIRKEIENGLRKKNRNK